jgi:hypothetical protein
MTLMPPHDVPSATELLDAVREFIDSEVIPHTEGRRRFEARVAANVVAIVQREMILGSAQKAAHAERLDGLGVADEEALARAIRSGELAERGNEVRAAVRATVADKLRVANPGYLESPPAS